MPNKQAPAYLLHLKLMSKYFAVKSLVQFVAAQWKSRRPRPHAAIVECDQVRARSFRPGSGVGAGLDRFGQEIERRGFAQHGLGGEMLLRRLPLAFALYLRLQVGAEPARMGNDGTAEWDPLGFIIV